MSLKNILLYLWQLPQNIIGLMMLLICTGTDLIYNSVSVRKSNKMAGGISLGKYIIINDKCNELTIAHEYGHCKQSLYLGPMYLLIIGLPSIIWASLYGTKLFPYTKNGYYKFYTEKWADKLGGANRE